MPRLSRLIFVFGLASAVFFIVPAFLSDQFALFPLMKIGDVFDIFTPLVLIPLYWLLYHLDQDKKLSIREGVLFLIFVALCAIASILKERLEAMPTTWRK